MHVSTLTTSLHETLSCDSSEQVSYLTTFKREKGKTQTICCVAAFHATMACAWD